MQQQVQRTSGLLETFGGALPELQRAFEEVTQAQAGHTQFGEIVFNADQESASSAARILDLLKPVLDAHLQGQVTCKILDLPNARPQRVSVSHSMTKFLPVVILSIR